MRFISFSGSSLITAAVALIGASASNAGCAPTSSTTTLTAADMPASAPESREASADVPAGKLVCKTNSVQEGSAELFLEWEGTSAKGVLRKIAPSGERSVQNVRAERFKGIIIADDTLTSDLVVHAATVAEYKGKPQMRLGDWKQSWSACE